MLACGSAGNRVPALATHPLGRASTSTQVRASSQPSSIEGPLVGEYSVAYDGRGELRVEAELERTGETFSVESGAESFLAGFEVAPASNAGGPTNWTRGERRGRSFVARPCGSGRCRIRYRYALREAAKKLDDLDVASEEGDVLEAPPSTWLLTPEEMDRDGRVRFRVTTLGSTSFVTGVYRAPAIQATAGDERAPRVWEIALADLWTAPYSAFGPLRVRTIMAGPAGPTQARIELAIAAGRLGVTDDQLVSWTSEAARAIVTYFGRFPVPEVLVLVIPSRGAWVGEGKTLSGGGAAIFMRVGERASSRALQKDWVLVHEMIHLAFPSVAREHDWAEEGLATYVEPFARVRAGTMMAEDAWLGLMDGLPNGLPAPGDRGLDQTPTWGRTYWGGALFYLLADVDIRKRSKGRFGLEHALRGILAAGGNNARRWDLGHAFSVGDKATGVPALEELHTTMGNSPHPVDLEEMWRELGIVRTGGTLRSDDSAPLAAIRRAITTATD